MVTKIPEKGGSVSDCSSPSHLTFRNHVEEVAVHSRSNSHLEKSLRRTSNREDMQQHRSSRETRHKDLVVARDAPLGKSNHLEEKIYRMQSKESQQQNVTFSTAESSNCSSMDSSECVVVKDEYGLSPIMEIGNHREPQTCSDNPIAEQQTHYKEFMNELAKLRQELEIERGMRQRLESKISHQSKKIKELKVKALSKDDTLTNSPIQLNHEAVTKGKYISTMNDSDSSDACSPNYSLDAADEIKTELSDESPTEDTVLSTDDHHLHEFTLDSLTKTNETQRPVTGYEGMPVLGRESCKERNLKRHSHPAFDNFVSCANKNKATVVNCSKKRNVTQEELQTNFKNSPKRLKKSLECGVFSSSRLIKNKVGVSTDTRLKLQQQNETTACIKEVKMVAERTGSVLKGSEYNSLNESLSPEVTTVDIARKRHLNEMYSEIISDSRGKRKAQSDDRNNNFFTRSNSKDTNMARNHDKQRQVSEGKPAKRLGTVVKQDSKILPVSNLHCVSGEKHTVHDSGSHKPAEQEVRKMARKNEHLMNQSSGVDEDCILSKCRKQNFTEMKSSRKMRKVKSNGGLMRQSCPDFVIENSSLYEPHSRASDTRLPGSEIKARNAARINLRQMSTEMNKFDSNSPRLHCMKDDIPCSKGRTNSISPECKTTNPCRNSLDYCYSCNLCGLKFCDMESLQCHMPCVASVTSKDPLKCGACTKTFKKSVDLEKHLQGLRTNKVFKCEICDNSCASKSCLAWHMQIHVDKEPEKCANRSKSLLSEESKTSQKSSECTICNKRFLSKLCLQSHMKQHKEIERDSHSRVIVDCQQESLVIPEKGSNSQEPMTRSFQDALDIGTLFTSDLISKHTELQEQNSSRHRGRERSSWSIFDQDRLLCDSGSSLPFDLHQKKTNCGPSRSLVSSFDCNTSSKITTGQNESIELIYAEEISSETKKTYRPYCVKCWDTFEDLQALEEHSKFCSESCWEPAKSSERLIPIHINECTTKSEVRPKSSERVMEDNSEEVAAISFDEVADYGSVDVAKSNSFETLRNGVDVTTTSKLHDSADEEHIDGVDEETNSESHDWAEDSLDGLAKRELNDLPDKLLVLAKNAADEAVCFSEELASTETYLDYSESDFVAVNSSEEATKVRTDDLAENGSDVLGKLGSNVLAEDGSSRMADTATNNVSSKFNSGSHELHKKGLTELTKCKSDGVTKYNSYEVNFIKSGSQKLSNSGLDDALYCLHCKKVFSSHQKLNKHMELHRLFGNSLCCSHCKQKFSLLDSLQGHTCKAYSILGPRFKCPECEEGFEIGPRLRRHMHDVHSLEQPFKCKQCGKQYDKFSHWNYHVQAHRTGKRYVCNKCGTKYKFLHHLKVGHLPCISDSAELKCPRCNLEFIKPSQLRSHMAICQNERAVKCQVCSQIFISESKLQGHMRCHTGDKPYQCSQCDKCFSFHSGLIRHVKCHSTEKPYVCDTCCKTFADKGRLQRHLKIHMTDHNNKTVQCGVCGRICNSRSALDAHLKSHETYKAEGEKLYSCAHCDKCFVHCSSLKRHLETVLLDPLKCDVGDENSFHALRIGVDVTTTSKLHDSVDEEHKNSLNEEANSESHDWAKDCLDGLAKRELNVLPDNLLILAKNAADESEDLVESFSEDIANTETYLDNGESDFVAANSSKEATKVRTDDLAENSSDVLGKLGSYELAEDGSRSVVGAVTNNVSSKFSSGSHELLKGCLPDLTKCRSDGVTKNNSYEVSFIKSGSQKLSNSGLDDVLYCLHCRNAFSSHRKLNKHMELHRLFGSSLRCSHCKQKFSLLDSLQEHTCKAYSILGPLFKCPECGEGFEIGPQLRRHMHDVHSLEQPFRCKQCGKQYEKFCHWNYHVQAHRNEKRYVCNKCGTKYKFLHHLKVGHLPCISDITDLKCPKCNLKFVKASQLRSHMAICQNERAVECQVCSRLFTSRSKLKSHMRSHTGDKPYKCSQCDKCFSFRAGLRWHVQCHSTEKPYVCDTCCKTFADKGRLQRHLKIHMTDHNNKTVQCDVCGRKYNSRSALDAHLKSHEINKAIRVKLYPCAHCDKCFVHCSSLKRHLETVLPDPLKCDVGDENSFDALRIGVDVTTTSKLHDSVDEEHKNSLNEEANSESHDWAKDCFDGLAKRELNVLPDNLLILAKNAADESEDLVESFSEDIANTETYLDNGESDFVAANSSKEATKVWTDDLAENGSDDLGKIASDESVEDRSRSVVGAVTNNVSSKFSSGSHELLKKCLPDLTKCRSDGVTKNSSHEVNLIKSVSQKLSNSGLDDELHCLHCRQIFSSHQKLNKHMELHRLFGSSLRCSDCKQKFSLLDSLQGHTCKAYSILGPRFKCPECEEGFEIGPRLRRHMHDVHSLERPFKCKQCGKQYDEFSHWNYHVQAHRTGSRYVCNRCGKKFKHLHHLKVSHLPCISDSAELKCPRCNLEFVKASLLRSHMAICQNERAVKCQVCSRLFVSQSKLLGHMRSHTGDKPYQCSQCEKCFSLRQTLLNHVQCHSAEKPYLCDTCCKTFASNKCLQRHLKIHMTEREKCSLGEKVNGASNQIQKTEKRRRKMPKRFYGCGLCGSLYITVISLKQHLPCEEGGTVAKDPLFCAECSERFCEINELEKHVVSVHGESLFICSICNKTFAKKRSLRLHMRSHTGGIPYKCKQCGKSFRSNCKLKYHLPCYVSPGSDIQCNRCQMTFNQMSQLRTHIKIDHSNKAVQCDVCGRKCNSRRALDAHLKSHETNKAEKEKPYSCAHCDKRFVHSSSLKRHLETVLLDPLNCDVGNENFKSKYEYEAYLRSHIYLNTAETDNTLCCLQCRTTFTSERRLKKHMKLHKQFGNSLHCSRCNQKFSTLDLLEGHTCQAYSILGPLFKCPECEEGFEIGTWFKKHMSEVHSMERPFKCKRCGKQYERFSAWNYHVQGHRTEKRFVCNKCGKRFTYLHHLKGGHLPCISESTELKCPKCNEEFIKASLLRNHVRLCQNERAVRCKACGRLFDGQLKLDKHMLCHTGQKPYQCPQCNKCFRVRQGLISHLYHHSDVKPYVCDVCGKAFAAEMILRTHVRIHITDRPYKCSECDKSYLYVSHLRHHKMKAHSNVRKRFTCGICSKTYCSKMYLDAHMCSHTGQNPYLCSVCGKGFPAKILLKYHMRVHTGEKPYPCQYCYRRFSMPRSLRNHERVHTGEKPYECTACGLKFSQSSYLKSHSKKVHMVQQESPK